MGIAKKYLSLFLLLLSLVSFAQNSDSTNLWNQYQNLERNQSSENLIDALQVVLAQAEVNEKEQLSNAVKEDLAALYLQNDMANQGLRYYFQLSNYYTKHQQFQDLFRVYLALSDYYETQSFPNNSAQYRLQALEVLDSTSIEEDRPLLLFDLGRLKVQAVEYEQSLVYLNPSDSLCVLRNRNTLLLQVLRLKGKAFEKLNRLDDAVIVNERILKLLEGENDIGDYTKQLNNLGFIEQKRGNSKAALNYFLNTLEQREKLGYGDESNVPLLINIGISNQNIGDAIEARVYLERVLKTIDETQSPGLEAEILDLISGSYLSEDDFYNAKIYNEEGLALMDGMEPEVEMELHLTASIIFEKLLQYQEALGHYKSYLDIKDSLDLERRLSQEELLQQQLYVEQTEKEVQALVDKNEIKDYQLQQLQLESENKDIQLKNQELDAKQKLQSARLRQQELEAARTEQELRAAKAREENQRLRLKQQELIEAQNQKNILLLEREAQVKDLELEQSKTVARNLVVIVLLAVLVMVLALFAVTKIRKSNKIINVEKKKSDNLLLNILPEATAEELKTLGSSLPRRYDKVAVLFTDFKGFTKITETMQPEELVDSLDLFFAGFDDIMKKHGIEKIKTIGDAYMCAAGIPDIIENPSQRMVKAAKEMLALTEEINARKQKMNQDTWGIRIGIHTGPVVAGVIGKYKFQYDVWGDAVNLAARMESSGEPGKINISESTFMDVSDRVPCTYRGEIAAKNKGNVKMYFVDT